MQLLETVRNLAFVATHLPQILKERNQALEVAADLQLRADSLQESLIDIENHIDEVGWQQIGPGGERVWNFSRDTISKTIALSRRIYLMNPLVRRSVDVEALYVWALGYSISSKNPDVQKVLDSFYKDPKNEAVFTSQPALEARHKDQKITGNTFLALFVNHDTGACRIRILPVDQITEIISDPQDSKDVWYYKREWSNAEGKPYTKLYADCNHYTEDQPLAYDGVPVAENVLVFHVRTGGFADMKFGLPELLSVFSWAIAYKDTLTNWATIIQAYARMAFKISGAKGRAGVAAAKTKLNTGLSSTRRVDDNPPNTAGGWFLASGGMDISAVKTAGATTKADEAKPLKDMVAAGAGIPSHFYGDSDSGNFATSTTLDRPTELKFVACQKLWMYVIESINEKLVQFSAQARDGILSRAGYEVVEMETLFSDEDTPVFTVKKGDADMFIEVSFPSILERNVTERVRAVVAAATLNGSSAEGIIPNRKTLCGYLLQAMDVPNWQEELDNLYPEEVVQGFRDPADELEIENKKAQGVADVGDAAKQQAKTAAKVAAKPTPKPAPAATGAKGTGGVTNRR